MEIKVLHNLTQEEAKNRISNFADELKNQYGEQLKNYTEVWDGNKADFSATALGANLSGTLEILSDCVMVTGKIPLMYKMFEPMVKEKIETTLIKVLN